MFQHIFVKAKMPLFFEGWLTGPSRGYYLVQVWGFKAMANLDQIITPENFARNVFFQASAETPIL